MSDAPKPLPCPFCGKDDVAVAEGNTFRWRFAYCMRCGAQASEVRVQTMGEGTREQWEVEARCSAIAEWNKRAPPKENSDE